MVRRSVPFSKQMSGEECAVYAASGIRDIGLNRYAVFGRTTVDCGATFPR